MKVFKSETGKAAIYETYDKLLDQWGIETEEADINGKYGSTHVIMTGDPDNPPLLLFHGVGDNSALMWIYNAKELASKYRLIAIDAIGGAGKSVPGPAYKKGFKQTQWISELMDSIGINKADAVGVSYGCYLVQLLKMELPDRIGKIVGMAGSIAVEGSKSSIYQMMKVFLPEALFPNDKNVIKLYNKLSGSERSLLTENKDFIEHWKLLLRNFNNTAISKHETKKKFSKADFIKIKKESLFIIGNCDILVYSQTVVNSLKEIGMNYEIIENAGHVVNGEFPGLINTKILTFLQN